MENPTEELPTFFESRLSSTTYGFVGLSVAFVASLFTDQPGRACQHFERINQLWHSLTEAQRVAMAKELKAQLSPRGIWKGEYK